MAVTIGSRFEPVPLTCTTDRACWWRLPLIDADAFNIQRALLLHVPPRVERRIAIIQKLRKPQ